MHLHDCIWTQKLGGVHGQASIVRVATLLHSAQIHIYQIIATALLRVESCMDVDLSCIAGLASLKHVGVGCKIDSDFVHGHSIAILSPECLHRVVQDEKVYLAWILFRWLPLL